MKTFTAQTDGQGAPDPAKHVRYTQGMVLGVDDFIQEFAYHSGRDQWMARDTIGYGTLNGLQVTIKDEEVVVSPGTAVSPSGQMIRVTPAQCANLKNWLAAGSNKKDLLARIGTGTTVPLHVVLCYRDCATDIVPIPGEPCRDEDALLAPSRLKDEFKLELRLDPPDQAEEDAVRRFVDWFRLNVDISDTATSVPLDEFLAGVRTAAKSTMARSLPAAIAIEARPAVAGVERPVFSTPATRPAAPASPALTFAPQLRRLRQR